MTFSEYLISKKIDESGFSLAEPELFHAWQNEFAQMHANSFTMQKLNLINPIRRKYPLKIASAPASVVNDAPPAATAPKANPKPVFKPKPKIS